METEKCYINIINEHLVGIYKLMYKNERKGVTKTSSYENATARVFTFNAHARKPREFLIQQKTVILESHFQTEISSITNPIGCERILVVKTSMRCFITHST